MKILKQVELENYSKRAYGQEVPLKIAGIICYEAGDVLRDIVRIEDYPHMENVYRKEARVSLGDVLAMSLLLCSLMEFDYEDVFNEGCDRAIDRCQEKLEGKDGF